MNKRSPAILILIFFCALMLLPEGQSISQKSPRPAGKSQQSTRVSGTKSKSGSGKTRKTTAARSVSSKTAARSSAKKTVSSKPGVRKASSKTSSSKKRDSKSTSVKRGSSKSAATKTKAIKLKRGELEKIREEISACETKIKESRKTEKTALERIDIYDRQTSLIRRVVSHLSVKIEDDRREIEVAQATLEAEKKRLDAVKAEYAGSLVHAYKRGRLHDTELLLSATSLNQMFIRSKYLRAFSGKQKTEAREIRERREAVLAQKKLLEEKVEQQRQTVIEKRSQEGALRRKTREHQALLVKARQDKSAYEAELRRKRAAAAKIERLIADLVERERRSEIEAAGKRAAASSPGRGGTASRGGRVSPLPDRAISQTAFGRLKGRLPWPVSMGRVVGAFGEQVNPKHGTVTISNGIDIQAAAGAAVKAVADGKVSTVHFLPGYGNLIIVNHDDGFRSVYAQLSTIGVSPGAKVKAGQVIARSGEGLLGPMMHFELWRQRNTLNPMNWLAR